MASQDRDSELKQPIEAASDSSPTRGNFEDIIDPQLEKRVVRKLDLNILPLIMLMQMFSFLDRSNIGNAKVNGLVTDLKLVGTQFNVAASVFYVTYIVFEIPYNIVQQRLGASRTIPAIVIAISLVTIFTGFVQSYGGLLATRLVLGFCEAGLFPGLNYYLSTMYTREEYAKRVCMLLVATALSGAFGGLFAYGLLQMDGVSGVAGWRWLFYIEGILSTILGVAAIFFLPSTAEEGRFLNAEEKNVARLRRLRRAEESEEGGIQWDEVREAFSTPAIWISGLIQFGGDVCLYGFSTFLPTIIGGLGYTSLKVQYLTIPIYLWGAIVYFATVQLMGVVRHENRSTYMILFGLFTIAGYAVLLGSKKAGVLYFACYLVASGLYVLTGLNITWIGANTKRRYKRAIAIAMNQTMGNAGGVVAGQIYLTSDSPRYHIGQAVSLSAMAFALILTVALYANFRRQNAVKAKQVAEGVEEDADTADSDRSIHFKYHL